MTNAKSAIADLFVKYHFGELTPLEKETLFKWSRLSPENQRTFKELTSANGAWHALLAHNPTLKKRPRGFLKIKWPFQLLKPKQTASSPAPLPGILSVRDAR